MTDVKQTIKAIKVSVATDNAEIPPSAKTNWAEFRAAVKAAVAKVAADFGHHEAEVVVEHDVKAPEAP